jgi:uncharacterized protein
MKYFRFILVGMLLGITLYKTEAVSWFRIFEMFHFQSFHMFGIIGSGVALGVIIVYLMKRGILKNVNNEATVIPDKSKEYKRYIIGGTIFGMGWAMAGVCPGPMFILLGSGYTVFVVFLAAAMFGTFTYGVLRKRLPH